MVIMLRQCCCGCTLKTGTIILGVLNIVSANFPSTLLQSTEMLVLSPKNKEHSNYKNYDSLV